MVKFFAFCSLTLGLLCPLAAFPANPPPPQLPYLVGYYYLSIYNYRYLCTTTYCSKPCFAADTQMSVSAAQAICINDELAENNTIVGDCYKLSVAVAPGPWDTSSDYPGKTYFTWLKDASLTHTPIGNPACSFTHTFTYTVQLQLYVDYCPRFLLFDGIDMCTYNGKPPEQTQLSVAAGSPFIPGFSVVVNGHVLTESELTLTVTQNGQPDAGVAVPLQSNRGSDDQIDDNNVTNGFGQAQADVSTRDQPGTSTITSASTDIETVQPGVITWLPANYLLPFLITCYAVAQESLDTTGPMETMRGILGEHHESFVNDTVMQGTGKLLSGQYVQWDWIHKIWAYSPCPRTTTGTCATTNSAAVDPLVIPKGAQIQISGIPNENRTAEDTGKAIRGYHIDTFFGSSAADYLTCRRFGVSLGHTVTLLGYGI